MTDRELLIKLKNKRVIELYGGLREKAQALKNRGFLHRHRLLYWTVTGKGKAYIKEATA